MRRVLIVLAVMALALPAVAQTPEPGPGPAEHVVARFLQLTPEQLDTWHGLIQAREEAAAPLREALAEVQSQLDELFAQEDPDPAAVGELVLEGRALKDELAGVHSAYVDGFEAMLDETQTDRLRLVRGAAMVQDVIPAFEQVGLVPRR